MTDQSKEGLTGHGKVEANKAQQPVAVKASDLPAYCPTEEMIADYHTKPLHDSVFVKFRNAILNIRE